MRALAIPACATRTEAQGREAYARMQRFGKRLAAQGKLRAVEFLASQSGAVRVTRDEAIALAHECPAAEWCTVEVRALAPCHDDSRA